MDKTKQYFVNARLNSYISAEATTARAGTGGRAAAMLIDEFAKIRDDVEIRSSSASITNCRIFVSTHLGLDTEFYNLCQTPEIDKEIVHWTQHPDKVHGLYKWDEIKQRIEYLDRTYEHPEDYPFVIDGSPVGGPHPGVRSPWYDAKCLEIGDSRRVAMELDINPTGSTSQFFEPLVIRSLINSYCCDPSWEGDVTVDVKTKTVVSLDRRAGGPLRLWVLPSAENKFKTSPYGAGADVAQGAGATPSCLTITDGASKEKVLEYANAHITPEKFADVAVALCRAFSDSNDNGAKLVWEARGPGVHFGQCIIESGYRNLYYHKNELKPFARAQHEKPGWPPTPATKMALLSTYKAALKAKDFLNRSERALRECLMFRYAKGNTVEHPGESGRIGDASGAGSNHGDITMADAMSYLVVKEFEKRIEKEQSDAHGIGTLGWRRQLAVKAEANADGWVA